VLAASRADLTAVERMGLLGHQWAAVRAGRAALPGFLELALAFGDERDPDVLTALRGPLAFAVDRLARDSGEGAQGALRARIAEAFAPAFEALGFEPGPKEDDDARLRRAALLALVGDVAEAPAVLGEAAKRCERYLADRRALDPNLADTVVALGARAGDAALFDAFLAAAEAAHTPQERRRMLLALGEFRDPALVERALALTLTETIGTQDVAILLVRMLANPAARAAAWEFVKRRWPKLRRRLPPMLASRPIEALPALGTRAARRDVAAFFRKHPVPTAARAVRQALERFDLDAELASRTAPELRRWLRLG
jgi:puromycin-sensitive aminopeptidase